MTTRAQLRKVATASDSEHAASRVRPGTTGGLPASIGRPAAQTLAAAGITTLDEVAVRSDAELVALHGVGPKAVRLLRAALAERI